MKKKSNKTRQQQILEKTQKKHRLQKTQREQTLRIAAAQINTLVGDVDGNATKIIAVALRAKHELHADMVIFPELVLTGYPPEDLLLRPELGARVEQALAAIKQQIKGIYVVISYPETVSANKRYSTASVIYNGKIIATYHKQKLPNYGVFDEKRYFEAGTKPCVCCIKGAQIAFTICEDLWFPEPMAQARAAGAKLMISLNASPFDMDKSLQRESIMRERAREGKMPVLYINCVGGQDELVFDGGSVLLSAAGEVMQRARFFEEDLLVSDFGVATQRRVRAPLSLSPVPSYEERIYKALVLGVRDYTNKNKFRGAIVSVSGGIDSALTLAIAVDALGKGRVETIYMPSRYSSALSKKVVQQQEKMLHTKLSVISIEPMLQEFIRGLEPEFSKLSPSPLARTACTARDTTEENIQARCRSVLLMAFSNKKNLLVLSTGNKSEMAVGYATLYGDMAGGFCVLKDVPKTLVYRLAHYRNSIGYVIPASVIKRAPSAELAPHQKDSDTLPPYPILDAILERYVENDQSVTEIVAAGFEEETVLRVADMVKRNEYKRRQSPPGVRITARAFGRDRRYPITSGF